MITILDNLDSCGDLFLFMGDGIFTELLTLLIISFWKILYSQFNSLFLVSFVPIQANRFGKMDIFLTLTLLSLLALQFILPVLNKTWIHMNLNILLNIFLFYTNNLDPKISFLIKYFLKPFYRVASMQWQLISVFILSLMR